ncbi:conserved Plasmodium protein, unknown function [Plasmodium ovale curtisi]|uniref:Uncharacterized protein n=1 Tax=Plasmodium ovale curtisi TaxID=864141 RepID=A0A1A8WYQ1_PLAOA|nr:conserved Plasmodium protein, unknown function [Plasmodium ovale curtisi]
MNEQKKLDIIRSMLNALLGDPEVEENTNNDNKNKLKKKYIDKSKKVISFYRNYMNKSEQKELEKFSNLYDIILNNSFEHSEKNNIDTYMYCNVFPILKKTFDSFVFYISNLIIHKNDYAYRNIIKNFNPILLFSQYIIRLNDDDDDDDFSLNDENNFLYIPSDNYSIEDRREIIHNSDKLSSFNLSDGMDTHLNYDCSFPLSNKKGQLVSTVLEKDISDFYNKYDTVEQENKLKEKQKTKEILKCIYDKKNVLSGEEISLYDAYYEENVKLKGKNFRQKNCSSINLEESELDSFNGRSLIPSSFSISLDLKDGAKRVETPEMEVAVVDTRVDAVVDTQVDAVVDTQVDAVVDTQVDAVVDTQVDAVGVVSNAANKIVSNDDFEDVIQQLEKKESSYFEKKIYLLLNKWIREEDGRRFIINQKSKIEPLFNDFKKKNYTVTDKDIIPLLFFIDRNLYLNYSLVHQYNYNNFYYIYHLHSSFYCSDTNSITFEEVWDFLVSNLPLNNYLYKDDVLKGLKKLKKKKKIVQNFHFTITFIKNFLLFFLIDMFFFFSNFIKKDFNTNEITKSRQNKGCEQLILRNNFYLYISSLSPFFSSSSGESDSSCKGKDENASSPKMVNSIQDIYTKGTSHSEDDFSYIPIGNIELKGDNNRKENMDHSGITTNGGRKKCVLMYFLLLLWGVSIKLNINSDEFLISEELSTDMDEETNEGSSEKNEQGTIKSEVEEGKHKGELNGKSNVHGGDVTKWERKKSRQPDENLCGKKKQGCKYMRQNCKYQSDSNVTPRRRSTRVHENVRSLSLNPCGMEHSSNKKRMLKETIRSKKKIEVEELKKIRKRKEEKSLQDLYELRKRYKRKGYNEKLTNFVHSIVRNVKPKRKNYYERVISKFQEGPDSAFSTILGGEGTEWEKMEARPSVQLCSNVGSNVGRSVGSSVGSNVGSHMDSKVNSQMDNLNESTLSHAHGGRESKPEIGMDGKLRGEIATTCDTATNFCSRYNSTDATFGEHKSMPSDHMVRNSRQKAHSANLRNLNENEIMLQIENFIKFYIKKKGKNKARTNAANEANVENADNSDEVGSVHGVAGEEEKTTSSLKKKKKKKRSPILLLCDFKLYKKKFLNKFSTEHIYLLLFFVHYLNTIMDTVMYTSN